MAGYREIALRRLGHLAGLLPPAVLKNLCRVKLIFPAYHLISDDPPAHVRNLYRVKSSRQFSDDLEFLLRHYQPIDVAQLQQIISGDRIQQRPSFLLSFDDGLREFYEVVAPILRAKGIPAICFVNTAFVDNKDLFYRYQASLLIEQLQTDKHTIAQLQERWPGSLAQLRRRILSIDYLQRETIEVMAARIGLDYGEYLLQVKPYLSRGQIQELLDDGFSIGAHSIDHPRYSLLSEDEQIRQTVGSLRYLEDHFDLKHRLFSFPFTDYAIKRSFFERLKQEFPPDFTFGSAGYKKDQVAFHLQRVLFEFADFSGRQIHNAELIYYLLKMPFGKNRLRRK